MLPNFVIAGTQKAGTTSLWSYLRRHPDVYMPETKEINFFDPSGDNWEKGVRWYERFFEERDGENAVGEASPRYMFYGEVPRRVHRVNQEMKLIFVLRNPVDRAYSHYWHSVRDGDEYITFEEALEAEEIRIQESPFARRAYSYVSRGMYYQQLSRFLDYFPRDQLLVLLLSDLKEGPVDFAQQTCEFLDVDPEFVPGNITQTKNPGRVPRNEMIHRFIHGRHSPLRRIAGALLPQPVSRVAADLLKRVTTKEGRYPPMDDQTRRRLRDRFSSDISKLEASFDLDLSHWQ